MLLLVITSNLATVDGENIPCTANVRRLVNASREAALQSITKTV